MEMLTNLNSSFYAFLVGCIFSLSIYHFSIYLQYTRKIYVLYSSYLFSISLFLFLRILPRDIALQLIFLDASILLCSISFYLKFANEALNFKEVNQKWYKLLNAISNLLLIIAPLMLVIDHFLGNDIQKMIYNYIAALITVFAIVFLMEAYSLKNKESRLFLLGSLIYLVSSNASQLLYLFVNREKFELSYGFEPMLFTFIGAIIESIVFALLVGYKVKQTELGKQKAEYENKIKDITLANIIKEQEIKSINALIEGQEKERLRIANDLHDDLGSHMATIKMYFSSFKDQDSKNLFDKTNTLIEEAYQKIRNIAHAKNAGVLAKQGLLKAVQDLARNISKSEQVNIKVYDNGLDQRLENSLELTLFRIIQELITNVIKHANATEVDIHLNEDEGMLNIMIEDNGQGFDVSQLTKNNKGMGLSSIDRRIEDLDGKMIIESQPNSGTSVIIDLPL